MWPQIVVLIWMVLAVVLTGLSDDGRPIGPKVMYQFIVMVFLFFVLFQGGFWSRLWS